MIEVKNLKKHYKQHKKQPGFLGSVKGLFKREHMLIKAVDDISFNIDEGEIVGFIGPNGAGKTTTLKVLSGLLYPTDGEVRVMGYDPYKRDYDYLKKIALVMGQKNQLWWDLPAIESFNLNKEIYEIDDKQYNKTLEELVELLELEDVLNVQVRKLSLGQRMKAELVAALIHSPKVLFLDEPTIGLDVVMQKKIREFFKEYNKTHKTTVILTSHYMDDVKELCQRLIIIDKGSLIYDGGLDQVVKKYADDKYLNVVFNSDVTKNDLKVIGEVIDHEPLKATIVVKRKNHQRAAAELLSKFPVDDLDISEVSLEDVIRNIFQEKTS